MSRLRRVLFQGGPLLPTRPNPSHIEERALRKTAHPRDEKSLAGQRLEILLTTPLIQAAHYSHSVYKPYGTNARSLSGYPWLAVYSQTLSHMAKSSPAKLFFSANYFLRKISMLFSTPGGWSIFARRALHKTAPHSRYSLWGEPIRQLSKIFDLFDAPAFEPFSFRTVLPIDPCGVDSEP